MILQEKPSKVVCVGRNYVAHAQELGHAIPESPILFIKPSTSVVTLSDGVSWPNGLGECHYECELCVQISRPLKAASVDEVKTAISAVTLGLDLTLRDLQNELKEQGYPWERAKAFDGACVLAPWLAPEMIDDWRTTKFCFYVNGTLKQTGDTGHMLYPVLELIAQISHNFTLLPGDVVMTGTPAGVGALTAGDALTLTLETMLGDVSWEADVTGARSR